MCIRNSCSSDICFVLHKCFHSKLPAMVLTVPIDADILDDEPAPLEEASVVDEDEDRSLEEIVRTLDFSEANLWEPRDSFKHRFNLDGLLLWDLVILQKYVKDDHAAFPVFKEGYADTHGKPIGLHIRSPRNDRDEYETRERYKRSIRADGYQQNARSRTVTIPLPNAPHPECRMLLAAAHCYEALVDCALENYECVQKRLPQNPRVQLSVKRGLQDCIDLHPNTPDDIQEWIVRNFNKFNCGSGQNLVQTWNVRVKLAQQFGAYRDKMKMSVKMCGGQAGYEAMHRSWLTEKSKCPVFSSHWEWYSSLGRFLNSLAEHVTGDASNLIGNRNIENLKKWLNRFVDNLVASDKLEIICRNMADADKILKKNYVTSMETYRFGIVWFEVMKACIPTVLPDHVFCLDKYNGNNSLLEMLGTSMENGKQVSLVVKKQRQRQKQNWRREMRRNHKERKGRRHRRVRQKKIQRRVTSMRMMHKMLSKQKQMRLMSGMCFA